MNGEKLDYAALQVKGRKASSPFLKKRTKKLLPVG